MAEEGTLKYRVKHSAARFGSVLPWFILIGLTGWLIWRAVEKPTQTQKVTVEKGGQAQFTTINKASRWFILFTELGVENRGGDLGVYSRAGARLEF